jgi:hypothetical protein
MPHPNATDRPVSWGLTGLGGLAAFCIRRFDLLPNIVPVGGLALYSGSRLPLWLAWAPALAVMAASDAVLAKLYGYPMFNPWVYASFVVYALIGRLLARTNAPGRIAAASVLGSVQFFLVTNFGTWLTSDGLATPMYPHTLAGLLACYVAGLPFLRYTLLGDLGTVAVLFGAHALLTKPAAAPVAEEARA